MDTKKSKETKMKIRKVDSQDEGKEIEGIMNSIKNHKVDEGLIPKSPNIVINNFTGKKLKITKSVVLRGRQYFVKAGTKWTDVDKFLRRHISFTETDFE